MALATVLGIPFRGRITECFLGSFVSGLLIEVGLENTSKHW